MCAIMRKEVSTKPGQDNRADGQVSFSPPEGVGPKATFKPCPMTPNIAMPAVFGCRVNKENHK